MLILASQSPRRREILTNAGIPFEVRVAGVPEQRADHETAFEYVQRLAREKAEAVESRGDEVVLGADTVVVVDEHILEKPNGRADAVRMLKQLSGRGHQVITGICLRRRSTLVSDTASTDVYFSDLSDDEINAYVDSGEPMDKAGGYAIQGLASKFIYRIEGDYFNVVGLPVSLVFNHLKELR